MITVSAQTKNKRGRPPLSAAKKMQRSKAAQNARATHKALRAKIALLKADFKERLRTATQEAYQKALEKVVKIEHKKMEALTTVKEKLGKKFSKTSQRIMMVKRRGRPSASNSVKKGASMKKRGRPSKVK